MKPARCQSFFVIYERHSASLNIYRSASCCKLRPFCLGKRQMIPHTLTTLSEWVGFGWSRGQGLHAFLRPETDNDSCAAVSRWTGIFQSSLWVAAKEYTLGLGPREEDPLLKYLFLLLFLWLPYPTTFYDLTFFQWQLYGDLIYILTQPTHLSIQFNGFSIFEDMCNHYRNQFEIFSSLWKETLDPFIVTFLSLQCLIQDTKKSQLSIYL